MIVQCVSTLVILHQHSVLCTLLVNLSVCLCVCLLSFIIILISIIIAIIIGSSAIIVFAVASGTISHILLAKLQLLTAVVVFYF